MRLLLALALLPVVAWGAAPAFVAVSAANSGNNGLTLGAVLCAEGAGGQENDLLVAGISHKDSATAASTSIDVPSGWTEVTQGYTTTLGANDFRYSIQYRVRGSSGPGNTTWTYGDGSILAPMRCSIVTYRPINPAAVWDVTFSEGSHRAVHLNAYEGSPTTWKTSEVPAPITTATDGALALIWHFVNTDGTALLPPSGYTIDANRYSANRGHLWLSKALPTAGTETPGPYLHTGGVVSSDALSLTFAIAPSLGLSADVLAAFRRRR